MDAADSWARISSSFSRRSQSRSDAYHGEENEGQEELRPEFLCPFCAENFDMVGLCCHFDEAHVIEVKNGVCPVCAKKVGSDLVRHLTVQHASLLKMQRRRRLRKVGSNLSLSILRKELQEGNLQSLLGGSSFSVPSSNTEPDPLLTSFIYNPAVVDEPPSAQTLSTNETSSMAERSVENLTDSRTIQQSPLSEEDLKEKARRCEFVQGLLLSTFVDDNL